MNKYDKINEVYKESILEACGKPHKKKIKEGADKKSEKDGPEYKAFFQKMLKKFGVSAPDELKGDKKKEFYDAVDKGWKGDNESDVDEATKPNKNKVDTNQFKKKLGKFIKKEISGGDITTAQYVDIMAAVDKITESINEGRNEIQKALRDVSGSISKEKLDKKDKNKILGYIRDAINLLNKSTGF